ncbi:hypothetical protein F5I97DRAFT_1923336 [Phlebopus sp. FC_14]|nr:hypothetical protein F5I97DRAFT_1923336 [Phlebopus sp. FC_14]
MDLLSPATTSSTPISQYYSLRPSPAVATSVLSSASPTSSSSVSLTAEDEENITVTVGRAIHRGKRKSQEDIRLLAISTHITELSYSISDIQTRIFEIQELRHKPQTDGADAATTAEIDKALMNMNDRLEAIERGMKIVSESVAPFQPSQDGQVSETSERAVMLRKHVALQSDWDAVQQETDELQQELKEDKWITVFRTVTEQADGMMSSLEKAVNRCQEFIWQVHNRPDDNISHASFSASVRSEKSPVSLEVFNSLLGSFQAKKAHYLPATTKVLAIMDNGVKNRVTKNGEALRRHAEAAKRWRVLQERMNRTEKEMENVRKILVAPEPVSSETGSTKSGHNGYLATPPSGSAKSRAPSRTSATSTLSRSMSPLRKFARKLTGSVKSPVTPPVSLPISRESSSSRGPSSEPVNKTLRRQRSSLFVFGTNKGTPLTPEKSHKHSQSLTPESSPASKRANDPNVTIKPRSTKQPWNSSTKVDQDGQTTIRPTPPKRPTAKAAVTPEYLSLAPCTPSRRSLSRSSNASSRPWSPVTSSISTAPSSNPSIPPLPPLASRPPSRAQTPGLGTTPRPRPRTPSGIPVPAMHWRSVSARQPNGNDDFDDDEITTLMQRAFSPVLTHSTSSPGTVGSARSHTPSGGRAHPARPPSRSMIPLPSVHVSSESRPSSTMSFYRPESPLTGAGRGSAFRAQTPESAVKARAQLVPVFTGGRPTARPSIQGGKLPPSSYRDTPTTRTPSRPGSRAGAYTPSFEAGQPVYTYVPANPKDPLDAEVAAIVNAIPHGLLIERVDPPLKTIPKEGEEIRASYAFSNSLSRKVVTCRLTTLTRLGAASITKKVMCRVGGGWQDLQLYMLNRQAGM